jgi:hypothetical protein
MYTNNAMNTYIKEKETIETNRQNENEIAFSSSSNATECVKPAGIAIGKQGTTLGSAIWHLLLETEEGTQRLL